MKGCGTLLFPHVLCYIDKSYKKENIEVSLLSKLCVFQFICNLQLAK